MAGVKKLHTSSYHPQTNGQCEHFNSTLLNMLGTLTPEQKKDWKNHVSAMVHAYNCTRNAATGFSPYYLLFGREPRLPVDVEFGLQRGSQRGATLDVGDLVLVKQTAWKGRHKIQDCWEEEEYQMVDQPTPSVPVYVVKSIEGGRARVLYRNILLPLQGRMRQEGVTGEESNPDSESEGEAPETPKATCGRPRRVSHVNFIKKRDVLSLTSLPSPEHRTGDGDSSEDEELITLSTPVDIPTSTLEEVEADKQSTTNEPDTDLSSDVQTLPNQSINDMESEHEPEQGSEAESDSDSSVPTIPRRSARSTKGIPPICYGQVQIKSTIISDLDKATRYM